MSINWDLLWRCAACMIFGWLVGFLETRVALKEKYQQLNMPKPEGILKLAYDADDPEYPAMGLEIEHLGYLMSHDYIVLKIVKKGFPSDKKVCLKNKKDESA